MLNQPYCNDATNADRTLTRNRIRHELLPLLARDYTPGVVDSLLRTALWRVTHASSKGRPNGYSTKRDGAPLQPGLSRLPPFANGRSPPGARGIRAPLAASAVAASGHGLGTMEPARRPRRVAAADCPATTITLPGTVSAQKTGEQLVLARS